jgi:Membrane protein involved in the export of O-antigen and teichoic acid
MAGTVKPDTDPLAPQSAPLPNGGDPHSHAHSLGKRYSIKLTSNILSIPLYFMVEALLPRVLGPVLYGQFSFVQALFTQIVALFDPGFSNCARTSFAKRPYELGLLTFFSRVSATMFALVMIVACSLYVPALRTVFLPGDIPFWLVAPTALCCFLTWAAGTARGMVDAFGTPDGELVRIVVNIISAIALVTVFTLGWLTLPLFLTLSALTFVAICLGSYAALKRVWRKRFGSGRRHADWRALFTLSPEQSRAYRGEYWRFCAPLVVVVIASASALAGERWILQFFGGNVAQGYFSLSQKIGMACFLFITAMVPLLMRELAVAHHKNDTAAMVRILDKFAPMLFAAAAWFSCFAAMEGREIIYLFGGSAYSEALLTVQLMALYPVHQTYGQITATVFYATGETRLFRNISLAGYGLGLVCAWLFVATPEYGGLGLGSKGLAYKMLLVQFISVNALLLGCHRLVPFNIVRNIAHQLVCPAFFALVAFGVKNLTLFACSSPAVALADSPHEAELSFLRFLVSGFLYTGITGAAVLFFPALIGVNRLELTQAAQRAFRAIQRKQPG